MKTLEEIDAMTTESKRRHFGTPDNNGYEINMSKERAVYFAKDHPDMYKGKLIVDAGCGYGDAAKFLAENFDCDIIGIEAHDVALDMCNKRNIHPRVTYKKALISDTKLPKESVDIVNAVEVIEHVDFEERDLTLKEWNRILKTEGFLYITTPERRGKKEEFPKGSHFMEYDFEEMVDIVQKAGFILVWHKRNSNTDGVSMALLFQKTFEGKKPIKLDDNTPVTDIDPLNNPVTRSCVDRYVLLSSYCKGKSVLSVSCGYGYGEMILKALGAREVIGLDQDSVAIDYINKTYAPQVTGIVHDFIKETVDLKRTFDVVLSVETFEHVSPEDTIHLIETMKRHARPDSILIITTPMRATKEWEYKGGTHKYEYSPKEFTTLMESYFGTEYKVGFIGLGESRINENYLTSVISTNNENEYINTSFAGYIMVAVITPWYK
ncbi:MAG: methyltransferase domain-containing protein [bacterium]|nr:methyltransferase domain-containing protein [bacterium]